MTDIEKAKVIRLREDGRSYSEIKKETGLSEGTIKTIVRRSKEPRKCEFCGKPLEGRAKRFCSDACRFRWHNAHRSHAIRKCPTCGREFVPADPRRVYCCASCYHGKAYCASLLALREMRKRGILTVEEAGKAELLLKQRHGIKKSSALVRILLIQTP